MCVVGKDGVMPDQITTTVSPTKITHTHTAITPPSHTHTVLTLERHCGTVPQTTVPLKLSN